MLRIDRSSCDVEDEGVLPRRCDLRRPNRHVKRCVDQFFVK